MTGKYELVRPLARHTNAQEMDASGVLGRVFAALRGPGYKTAGYSVAGNAMVLGAPGGPLHLRARGHL